MGANSTYIVVGKIGAPHGVRGWVKIHSFTEVAENLLDYQPWYVGKSDKTQDWQVIEVLEAQEHGKGLIARFKGCNDRDAATELRNQLIAVTREQLPEPEEGEYYWVDLEDLKVVNLEGIELGTVDHLMETGANDVLVVKSEERERLIPYVQGAIVKEVDIKGGVIRVDWGADYE
jgi:16S rRNA processing protein RimM